MDFSLKLSIFFVLQINLWDDAMSSSSAHHLHLWTLVSGRCAAERKQITWNTGEEISFYWYVDRFIVFRPIDDKKPEFKADRIVKNRWVL